MPEARAIIRSILDDPLDKRFAAANYIISAVTVVSVGAIIVETVPALDAFERVAAAVEYISVGFFTIEYFMRLFSAERPLRYVFSFFGIVDLISILPVYVAPAGVGAFHAKEHAVRMARFLRILRLVKIVRHRAMRLHHRTRARPSHARLHLITIEAYIVAVLASILMLASALYAFEGSQPGFATILHSILWIGETIFGGSISVNLPMTIGGRIIAILTRFTGLVLFGLLVTVVAKVVNHWLLGAENIAERK